MQRASGKTIQILWVISSVFGLATTVAVQVQAQNRSAHPQLATNAVVHQPIRSDVSPPLRELPTEIAPQVGERVIHPPLQPKLDKLKSAGGQAESNKSPAVVTSPGPLIDATIGLNFDGVGQNATNNCPSVSGFFVVPSDSNLAVGDTQVVEWVNLCYAVFDKSTGALVAGPFPGNHFWKNFGGACESANDGDPIIQWDKANHVWVAAQNVFTAPFLTCIAVSQTADATGVFNRYAFSQPGFPDSPKWGLTPNAYYQTVNDFGALGTRFAGVNVCAYDGTALRAGVQNAAQICILDNSNGTLFDDSLLPADNDYVASSATTPPEILMGSIDNTVTGSAVYYYIFDVNFTAGTATLAGVNGTLPITVPTFTLACGRRAKVTLGDCIRQPAPSSPLEASGDRLMYRLAHFDDGTTQHFMVTHSIEDTTAVAAKWYEFRASSGSTTLSLYQSGQTPDDGEFRWMGSIARDQFGNIALAYSRSSAQRGDYPSIYFSGQTAGEALGTTDAEQLIFAGTGSQVDSSGRWGDYSSMALDGADLCSFWYTNQYYPATARFLWSTRIGGQIRFPSCR